MSSSLEGHARRQQRNRPAEMLENQRRNVRLVESAAPILPANSATTQLIAVPPMLKIMPKMKSCKSGDAIFRPDEGRQEGKHEDNDLGIEAG